MKALIILLTLMVSLANVQAEPASHSTDLYPDDFSDSPIDNVGDDKKDALELYTEGSMLLMDERLLDARSKLLKALAADPKFYKAHIMLASYYTTHVGHFRLALKYIKRAEELFKEQNGRGPYIDSNARIEHAQILYMLAQIRLSLDEYDNALEVLDRFESAGYFGDWYPGTRAWVLMKLGRISDAIEVARVGVLAGAEPGRTMNMLGILYSVADQREKAIKIFNDAIDYEFSLGSAGQPATPLNNQAEVYREVFDEDRAETGWSRALSLPDGCEHVLPALNLSIMLNEQLRFGKSWSTMTDFNRCVAQYALRNGEEHRALVNLAMGRILMHTGQVEKAVILLRDALAERQWFGKIGTNEDDMQAAASISLAQALRRLVNVLSIQSTESLSDWLELKLRILKLQTERWWLLRRTKTLVSSEMNSFEDLDIRHTDSVIEYPWLGEFLSSFPKNVAIKRIEAEASSDDRPRAKKYYDLFKAEVFFENGEFDRARSMIDELIPLLRPSKDAALVQLAHLIELGMLKPTSPKYQKIAFDLYREEHSALLTNGLALPVKIKGTQELISALDGHAFQLADSPIIITANRSSDGDFNISADLSSIGGKVISEKGATIAKAVNAFTASVFKSSVTTIRDSK